LYRKLSNLYHEIENTAPVIIGAKYRLLVEMNKSLSRGTFGKEILIRVEFDDFCLYLGPKTLVDFCL
jgi:hypothetical protein